MTSQLKAAYASNISFKQTRASFTLESHSSTIKLGFTRVCILYMKARLFVRILAFVLGWVPVNNFSVMSGRVPGLKRVNLEAEYTNSLRSLTF